MLLCYGGVCVCVHFGAHSLGELGLRAPNLSSNIHWICSASPRHCEGSYIARGRRWQEPSSQCLDAAPASPCHLSGCSHPLKVSYIIMQRFLISEKAWPNLSPENVSKCEVAHRMCKSHSSHFSSQYSPKFCIVGELYSIRLLVPRFQA